MFIGEPVRKPGFESNLGREPGGLRAANPDAKQYFAPPQAGV